MPRSSKKKNKEQPYIKPNYHEQKHKNHDEKIEIQKQKLRSSNDIYNRLTWDKTLDIDLNQVHVGYFDRIKNEIAEIPFKQWTPIEQGGDIPQHLIEYFKLIISPNKFIHLWNKKKKLDRLYGSGKTQPCQFIQNVSNQIKQKKISKPKQNNIVLNDPYSSKKFIETLEKFFPRYPTSKDDGFMVSFDVNDKLNWIKALKIYGFVVIGNILSEEECAKTINSMIDEVYETAIKTAKQHNSNRDIAKLDLKNPTTWHTTNFPTPWWKWLCEDPAFSHGAFVNRNSELIFDIFKTIHGNEKLNCSIDHWGIGRGTKYLNFYDLKTKKLINQNVERTDWRSFLNPHWDINPWEYNQNLKNGFYENIFQGCLALTDHTQNDGCHLALPGCINFLDVWCNLHKCPKKNLKRFNIDLKDIIVKYMQPIPLRKGEMLIWNYGNLHGTTPNNSNRMRLVQYIRMFPAMNKYIIRDKYSPQNVKNGYKNKVNIRDILGKNATNKQLKLFGLQPYSV